MIIYLFNDQFFTKVNLPSIVNGMYSLSEEEKRLILSNPKVEVRFKCVEIYEKIRKML